MLQSTTEDSMAGICDLPTEVFTMILELVGKVSLLRLIVAQRVNSRFRAVIKNILHRAESGNLPLVHMLTFWNGVPVVKIHPLWRLLFDDFEKEEDCLEATVRRGGLRWSRVERFNSNDLSARCDERIWPLGLREGNPHASWRRLSPIIGGGLLPIIDVLVSIFRYDERNESLLHDIDMKNDMDAYTGKYPSGYLESLSGGLNLGHFYDIISSLSSGLQVVNMALGVGKRVRYNGRVLGLSSAVLDSQLVDVDETASQSAVLYVKAEIRKSKDGWLTGGSPIKQQVADGSSKQLERTFLFNGLAQELFAREGDDREETGSNGEVLLD